MIFLNDLQKDTLLLVDNLIEQKKTHEEIAKYLNDNGYNLFIPTRNGYASKTKIDLYKKGENTFVTLIKRKNGLAYWETIKLS